MVPGGICQVRVAAFEASKVWTSDVMLVPSQQRFAGKGRISGSDAKNFSALLIPCSSQPLSKRDFIDMAPMLAASELGIRMEGKRVYQDLKITSGLPVIRPQSAIRSKRSYLHLTTGVREVCEISFVRLARLPNEMRRQKPHGLRYFRATDSPKASLSVCLVIASS